MSRKKPVPAPAGHQFADGALSDWRALLDRSTCIYGESDSGKTQIIRHVLMLLAPHAPEGTFFTRSADSFATIPPCYIFGSVGKAGIGTLQEIWARQTAKTEVYHRANDMDVLEKLFMRCGTARLKGTAAARKRLSQVAAIRAAQRAAPSADDQKHNDLCNEIARETYKIVLREHIRWLRTRPLEPAEAFALDNINFNHRHVLVFDDVSADVSSIKKTRIFQDLIYAGRHKGITIIISIHDDKILDSETKKNIHNSIFANLNVLQAFFRRQCMDFSRELQARTEALIEDPTTFEGFHKILYAKRNKAALFTRFVVEKRDADAVKFGSQPWLAFGWGVSAGLEKGPVADKYMQEFL